MFELYDNKIKNEILIKMYNILIENLFITYPEFLLNKKLHDNKDNYNKWSNSIKSMNNYNILTYSLDNELVGFLNYGVFNDEMWFSEVQIKNNYKNKGILKFLIKEFLIINKNSLYKSIKLHINDKNELSKKVFKHIEFKNVESNIYKIDIEKLISYTKPF